MTRKRNGHFLYTLIQTGRRIIMEKQRFLKGIVMIQKLLQRLGQDMEDLLFSKVIEFFNRYKKVIVLNAM